MAPKLKKIAIKGCPLECAVRGCFGMYDAPEVVEGWVLARCPEISLTDGKRKAKHDIALTQDPGIWVQVDSFKQIKEQCKPGKLSDIEATLLVKAPVTADSVLPPDAAPTSDVVVSSSSPLGEAVSASDSVARASSESFEAAQEELQDIQGPAKKLRLEHTVAESAASLVCTPIREGIHALGVPRHELSLAVAYAKQMYTPRKSHDQVIKLVGEAWGIQEEEDSEEEKDGAEEEEEEEEEELTVSLPKVRERIVLEMEQVEEVDMDRLEDRCLERLLGRLSKSSETHKSDDALPREIDGCILHPPSAGQEDSEIPMEAHVAQAEDSQSKSSGNQTSIDTLELAVEPPPQAVGDRSADRLEKHVAKQMRRYGIQSWPPSPDSICTGCGLASCTPWHHEAKCHHGMCAHGICYHAGEWSELRGDYERCEFHNPDRCVGSQDGQAGSGTPLGARLVEAEHSGSKYSENLMSEDTHVGQGGSEMHAIQAEGSGPQNPENPKSDDAHVGQADSRIAHVAQAEDSGTNLANARITFVLQMFGDAMYSAHQHMIAPTIPPPSTHWKNSLSDLDVSSRPKTYDRQMFGGMEFKDLALPVQCTYVYESLLFLGSFASWRSSHPDAELPEFSWNLDHEVIENDLIDFLTTIWQAGAWVDATAILIRLTEEPSLRALLEIDGNSLTRKSFLVMHNLLSSTVLPWLQPEIALLNVCQNDSSLNPLGEKNELRFGGSSSCWIQVCDLSIKLKSDPSYFRKFLDERPEQERCLSEAVVKHNSLGDYKNLLYEARKLVLDMSTYTSRSEFTMLCDDQHLDPAFRMPVDLREALAPIISYVASEQKGKAQGKARFEDFCRYVPALSNAFLETGQIHACAEGRWFLLNSSDDAVFHGMDEYSRNLRIDCYDSHEHDPGSQNSCAMRCTTTNIEESLRQAYVVRQGAPLTLDTPTTYVCYGDMDLDRILDWEVPEQYCIKDKIVCAGCRSETCQRREDIMNPCNTEGCFHEAVYSPFLGFATLCILCRPDVKEAPTSPPSIENSEVATQSRKEVRTRTKVCKPVLNPINPITIDKPLLLKTKDVFAVCQGCESTKCKRSAYEASVKALGACRTVGCFHPVHTTSKLRGYKCIHCYASEVVQNEVGTSSHAIQPDEGDKATESSMAAEHDRQESKIEPEQGRQENESAALCVDAYEERDVLDGLDSIDEVAPQIKFKNKTNKNRAYANRNRKDSLLEAKRCLKNLGYNQYRSEHPGKLCQLGFVALNEAVANEDDSAIVRAGCEHCHGLYDAAIRMKGSLRGSQLIDTRSYSLRSVATDDDVAAPASTSCTAIVPSGSSEPTGSQIVPSSTASCTEVVLHESSEPTGRHIAPLTMTGTVDDRKRSILQQNPTCAEFIARNPQHKFRKATGIVQKRRKGVLVTMVCPYECRVCNIYFDAEMDWNAKRLIQHVTTNWTHNMKVAEQLAGPNAGEEEPPPLTELVLPRACDGFSTKWDEQALKLLTKMQDSLLLWSEFGGELGANSGIQLSISKSGKEIKVKALGNLAKGEEKRKRCVVFPCLGKVPHGRIWCSSCDKAADHISLCSTAARTSMTYKAQALLRSRFFYPAEVESCLDDFKEADFAIHEHLLDSVVAIERKEYMTSSKEKLAEAVEKKMHNPALKSLAWGQFKLATKEMMERHQLFDGASGQLAGDYTIAKRNGRNIDLMQAIQGGCLEYCRVRKGIVAATIADLVREQDGRSKKNNLQNVSLELRGSIYHAAWNLGNVSQQNILAELPLPVDGTTFAERAERAGIDVSRYPQHYGCRDRATLNVNIKKANDLMENLQDTPHDDGLQCHVYSGDETYLRETFNIAYNMHKKKQKEVVVYGGCHDKQQDLIDYKDFNRRVTPTATVVFTWLAKPEHYYRGVPVKSCAWRHGSLTSEVVEQSTGDLLAEAMDQEHSRALAFTMDGTKVWLRTEAVFVALEKIPESWDVEAVQHGPLFPSVEGGVLSVKHKRNGLWYWVYGTKCIFHCVLRAGLWAILTGARTLRIGDYICDLSSFAKRGLPEWLASRNYARYSDRLAQHLLKYISLPEGSGIDNTDIGALMFNEVISCIIGAYLSKTINTNCRTLMISYAYHQLKCWRKYLVMKGFKLSKNSFHGDTYTNLKRCCQHMMARCYTIHKPGDGSTANKPRGPHSTRMNFKEHLEINSEYHYAEIRGPMKNYSLSGLDFDRNELVHMSQSEKLFKQTCRPLASQRSHQIADFNKFMQYGMEANIKVMSTFVCSDLSEAAATDLASTPEEDVQVEEKRDEFDSESEGSENGGDIDMADLAEIPEDMLDSFPLTELMKKTHMTDKELIQLQCDRDKLEDMLVVPDVLEEACKEEPVEDLLDMEHTRDGAASGDRPAATSVIFGLDSDSSTGAGRRDPRSVVGTSYAQVVKEHFECIRKTDDIVVYLESVSRLCDATRLVEQKVEFRAPNSNQLCEYIQAQKKIAADNFLEGISVHPHVSRDDGWRKKPVERMNESGVSLAGQNYKIDFLRWPDQVRCCSQETVRGHNMYQIFLASQESVLVPVAVLTVWKLGLQQAKQIQKGGEIETKSKSATMHRIVESNLVKYVRCMVLRREMDGNVMTFNLTKGQAAIRLVPGVLLAEVQVGSECYNYGATGDCTIKLSTRQSKILQVAFANQREFIRQLLPEKGMATKKTEPKRAASDKADADNKQPKKKTKTKEHARGATDSKESIGKVEGANGDAAPENDEARIRKGPSNSDAMVPGRKAVAELLHRCISHHERGCSGLVANGHLTDAGIGENGRINELPTYKLKTESGANVSKMDLCWNLSWRCFEHQHNLSKERKTYPAFVFDKLEIAGQSVKNLLDLVNEILAHGTASTVVAKQPRNLPF